MSHNRISKVVRPSQRRQWQLVRDREVFTSAAIQLREELMAAIPWLAVNDAVQWNRGQMEKLVVMTRTVQAEEIACTMAVAFPG